LLSGRDHVERLSYEVNVPMNTNIIALTTATLLTLACGSDPNPAGGAGAGGALSGVGGQAIAGQPATAAGGTNNAAGGSTGGLGGAGSSSLGGSSAVGGAGGAAGGTSGGASGAGASGAGASGAGHAGAGGNGGAAGGPSSTDVAKALDGVRVDDACSGTADTSVGAVCGHVMLTSSGGSKYAKNVTIAGVSGTTYDVTLRIRGIVEPTKITGGMPVEMNPPSTIQYMGKTWRKTPYTIGGAASASTTDTDYTQWRIGVASPKGDYYLNDYQQTGHYIFKLDYQVTIQMAANTTVTLDAVDRNERQIVNFEKYTIDGIPGSVNYGQFVQINVVSAQPH
jgi:hypothetical protein